ncbi:isochorismatase hydrolase [Acetobacter nitrogenifigens DSM 23921 = NBRC 105050]|uniref:Hydrolase n=1 Tax=Acetobacter nitrogenifigens DSM 23921 = NBRC 105050 TaxID=1120919 RepID=A0A511XC40_9PROT|nr:hydrolase [Acetobacter nitrogenifigens]GBQ88636.1 isochorismatase hydrolase [Acetobacter nitrogenifigens DSM 23921 = NBRC 105050]GEN60455.1 hydrolase [Acetobacter nitrogenifigens DSM 23921 = NBRC 105050]
MISLPASTTALVLIDLQKGIMSYQLEPHASDAILSRSKLLAQRFRAAGAPVVLVNVAFAADFADAVKTPVDRSLAPPTDSRPANWSELCDDLAEPSDLRVTKRQWGAFYGTELDLQLRRRGVRTIVLGGVATNMGVESTARAAHEHGYGVVVAEDVTSSLSKDMHDFAFEKIFPMLGRVTTSDAVELTN